MAGISGDVPEASSRAARRALSIGISDLPHRRGETDVISLACGVPAAEAFPVGEIADAKREVLDADPALLVHSQHDGPLRRVEIEADDVLDLRDELEIGGTTQQRPLRGRADLQSAADRPVHLSRRQASAVIGSQAP